MTETPDPCESPSSPQPASTRRDDPPAHAGPDAIAFYTRPGCPFSASLLRRLRSRGLPLEVHDIWIDRDAAAFVRSVARGNETVPTVVVGDAAMVNPSARQVLAETAARAPHLLPGPGTADTGHGWGLRARLRRAWGQPAS